MKILRYPHPSLSKFTKSVDTSKGIWFNDVQQVSDVLQNCPNGAALAANQVGIDLNFFVLEKNLADKFGIMRHSFVAGSEPIAALINPAILEMGDKVPMQESCLSFPGVSTTIDRHAEITVEYNDIYGDLHTLKVTDPFLSQIFQHEIEHLEGETFLKNMPRIERFQVIGKMRRR